MGCRRGRRRSRICFDRPRTGCAPVLQMKGGYSAHAPGRWPHMARNRGLPSAGMLAWHPRNLHAVLSPASSDRRARTAQPGRRGLAIGQVASFDQAAGGSDGVRSVSRRAGQVSRLACDGIPMVLQAHPDGLASRSRRACECVPMYSRRCLDVLASVSRCTHEGIRIGCEGIARYLRGYRDRLPGYRDGLRGYPDRVPRVSR